MTVTFNHKSQCYVAVVRTASGKTKTVKTYQTNKEDALRVLKEAKVEELERATIVGLLTNEAISLIQSDKKITLAEALTKWLEWLRVRHRSATAYDYELVVRAWLSGVDLEKSSPRIVEEKHVYDWINDSEWKAKESTRRSKLAAIKSFCQFCYDENYMAKDPSHRVFVSTDTLTHAQKERKARTIFSDADIEKLLAEFKPGQFWHTAVTLGRYAGLRIGDVCRLEWESLKTPGVLTVWTHKRHKPVHVPIHPRLEQALKDLPPSGNTFVFPEQREVILDLKRRSGLSHVFKRACKRLGIGDKCYHDLRRTFCTVQAQNGTSVQDIGKLVGHSHEATTNGYIQQVV